MGGGKGTRGESKAYIVATENKQPEISGLDQRAQRITIWLFITGSSLITRFAVR